MTTLRVVKMSKENSIASLLDEVQIELQRAEALHPLRQDDSSTSPTYTPHGGYSVCLEELEEFWDEVKAFNLPKGRDTRPKMRKELIQLAAMALRTIRDSAL